MSLEERKLLQRVLKYSKHTSKIMGDCMFTSLPLNLITKSYYLSCGLRVIIYFNSTILSIFIIGNHNILVYYFPDMEFCLIFLEYKIL